MSAEPTTGNPAAAEAAPIRRLAAAPGAPLRDLAQRQHVIGGVGNDAGRPGFDRAQLQSPRLTHAVDASRALFNGLWGDPER